MTRLPARFVEDRALRDAARAVLAEDIERLQGNLGEQGIASRFSSGVTSSISTRIRSGARDVLDQVTTQAGDNRGVLALLVGAIILWFARAPILAWFANLLASLGEEVPVDHAPPQDAATPGAASQGDPA